MKPTNPKITWQPYPATRPTEAGDYFVTIAAEGSDPVTHILPFSTRRGRFFYRRYHDTLILAWAPRTTAHLIRYDEEKPKSPGRYLVKLATPNAASPFTYRTLCSSSNGCFFGVEKDVQVIAWEAVHGRSPMKKLNEIDWFFIIVVLGFAALAVSFVYAVGKIITEIIRWGF